MHDVEGATEGTTSSTARPVALSRRLSEGSAMGVLFFAATACAFGLCLIPRAVPARELPALALTRQEVESQLREDALAAAQAPRDDAALELDRAYLELGEAEVRGVRKAGEREKRAQHLYVGYRRVLHASGPKGVLALRARATARFEAALDGELPSEQLDAVLGTFPSALRAHHATREGRELVPHFVLRTLYKTRWNRAMGQPEDDALSPVERRALHGFLALHAENLPLPARLASLDAYAVALGRRVAEAHGVLLFRSGDFAGAIHALRHAAEERPNLRVRNYLAGARAAARPGAFDARNAPPTPSPDP